MITPNLDQCHTLTVDPEAIGARFAGFLGPAHQLLKNVENSFFIKIKSFYSYYLQNLILINVEVS